MGNRDDNRDRSDGDVERRLTASICQLVDSPRSLAVALLLKYGEDRQLADLDVDPSQYQEHRHFAGDYLVTELMSKSVTLKTGIDTKQVAVAGFWEAEQGCGEVNRGWLQRRRERPYLVYRVSQLVKRALPPLFGVDGKPSASGKWTFRELERAMRHGPGASTSVSGTGSVPSDKYDAEVHLTHGLYPFARALMGDRWADLAHKTIVRGNRHTTVPKNARKDRNICVEPGLNVFYQLGLGGVVRNRLKRLGVDLDDQSWNQFLASRAQVWSLATIDLSAASDTISYAVVEDLLPPDWFELFLLGRSPETLINGEWVRLEKFSSMGNGYTFELETLLFSSIVRAVVDEVDWPLCATYGDDIIVPQKYAPAVVEALEFFGFKANSKKTYLAGRFFESCGTDWFDGKPVRPFYCRKQKGAEGIPYSLQLANSLRLYANRRMGGFGCDSAFREIWTELVRSVPHEWRHPVPPSLGDAGLIVDVSEKGPVKRASGGLEGWFVPCVTLKSPERRKHSLGRLLAELARIESRGHAGEALFTRGKEPIRGYLGKPMTKKVQVKNWTGSLFWW